MNTTQALRILREELDKHGLHHVQVKLNSRFTNTFGQYSYHRLSSYKVVQLSTKLVELNDEDRVRLTILHEVAHALTEGHGHDSVWKAKLLEIGGDGKRTYSRHDTNTLERKRTLLQAYCPEHGDRGRFYRKVNRACGSCCNAYNDGRYSPEYKLQFREL